MPSPSSIALFNLSKAMVDDLRSLVVTDAWYSKSGGNIEVASQTSQKHSMSAVLSGIQSLGKDTAMEALGGGSIAQSRESWLRQGEKTLGFGKGICTDCAAAAGVGFLRIVEASDYEARVEIISTGTHAFLVVNREGEVKKPDNWGDSAFVIDVWYQNQNPKVSALFWAADLAHPVAKWIRQSSAYLRIDATLREVIGSLFD